MKKTAILLFVLVLVLTGCSYNYPGPVYENHLRPAEGSGNMLGNLTQEEMLEDYDYFWDTLDETYPFLGVAQRQGIDYNKIQSSYRDKIDDSTSDEEFLFYFAQISSDLYYLGHLGLISPDSFTDYHRSYKEFAKSASGMGAFSHGNYLFKTLDSPLVLEAYSRLMVPGSVDELKEKIEPLEGNITSRIYEKENILYLKIQSFLSQNVEYDGKILRDLLNDKTDFSHVIIDIRGNGGGSDGYWTGNLVPPFIGNNAFRLENSPIRDKNGNITGFSTTSSNESFSNTTYSLFNGNSDLIQGYVSSNTHLYPRKIPIYDLPPMSNLQPEDGKLLTHAFPFEYNVNKVDNDFQGKVWLLVDEYVYSSSESFAMFAKGTGFATLIGTQTGGDGGGIDPMLFTLPNSGIVWRHSVLYSINPDGSNNEEFGTTPDIVVGEKDDALKVCLEEIAKSK